MEKELKTVSFGGLGDSVIVVLKLNQLLSENPEIQHINHLFIESNQKTLDWIKEYMIYTFNTVKLSFNFECAEDYQDRYLAGKWCDRKPINTSWHGEYHFPWEDKILIQSEFATIKKELIQPKWDVCLQVSAGANSDRNWKFHPFDFRKIVERMGYKCVLVGTDERYAKHKDFQHRDNFCDPDGSITQTLNVVNQSKIIISLSGFLTYHSLMIGKDVIHLEESEEHVKHYLHPVWKINRFGIKYPVLSEVVSELMSIKEIEKGLKK